MDNTASLEGWAGVTARHSKMNVVEMMELTQSSSRVSAQQPPKWSRWHKLRCAHFLAVRTLVNVSGFCVNVSRNGDIDEHSEGTPDFILL